MEGTKRQTVFLFGLRTIRTFVSIFNLSLSARFFGVSIERDIWILALNCLLVLDMAVWGPINETFRAKFILLKEQEGERGALDKTRSLLLYTNAITILIVALVLLKAELLARLIAPGLKMKDLSSLALMIRIIAPSFLFNQITQICISILNTYNSFYIPEISSCFSSVFTLLCIFIFAPHIGIYSLVISYYAGLFVLIVLLIGQITKRKIGIFRGSLILKFSMVQPFILYALPFFFPYFAGQVNLIVEKSIASILGEGTVSIIDYSRKFTEIPLSVLSGVLTSILVPVLTLKYAQARGDNFINEFKNIMQLGFIILTVLIIMLTVCSKEIVGIVYSKDKVGLKAFDTIVNLTIFYSWSSIGVFLYLIFGMALLSANRGRVYAIYGVIAQVIMVLLNFILYKVLNVYAFPIAVFSAHLFSAFLMYLKFPYKSMQPLFTITKYGTLLVTCCLLVYWSNKLLPSSTIAYLMVFRVMLILGLILVAASFIFKLDERLILLRLLKKRAHK